MHMHIACELVCSVEIAEILENETYQCTVPAVTNIGDGSTCLRVLGASL